MLSDHYPVEVVVSARPEPPPVDAPLPEPYAPSETAKRKPPRKAPPPGQKRPPPGKQPPPPAARGRRRPLAAAAARALVANDGFSARERDLACGWARSFEAKYEAARRRAARARADHGAEWAAQARVVDAEPGRGAWVATRAKLGEGCHAACGARRPAGNGSIAGGFCVRPRLADGSLATCARLTAAFGCPFGCAAREGKELPAFVAEADADDAGRCLLPAADVRRRRTPPLPAGRALADIVGGRRPANASALARRQKDPAARSGRALLAKQRVAVGRVAGSRRVVSSKRVRKPAGLPPVDLRDHLEDDQFSPPPPPKKKPRRKATALQPPFLAKHGFVQHPKKQADACTPAHPVTARLCPCAAAATFVGARGASCAATCGAAGLACHDDVLRAFNDVACLPNSGQAPASVSGAARFHVLPLPTEPFTETSPARALPALVPGTPKHPDAPDGEHTCLAASNDARPYLSCAAASPDLERLCPCSPTGDDAGEGDDGGYF